jgi:hypothetical protein
MTKPAGTTPRKASRSVGPGGIELSRESSSVQSAAPGTACTTSGLMPSHCPMGSAPRSWCRLWRMSGDGDGSHIYQNPIRRKEALPRRQSNTLSPTTSDSWLIARRELPWANYLRRFANWLISWSLPYPVGALEWKSPLVQARSSPDQTDLYVDADLNHRSA